MLGLTGYRILRACLIVILHTSCLIETAKADDRRSKQGESCMETADCEQGLTCKEHNCYSEEADSSRKSLQGESCGRTADCAVGLRCLSNVCQSGIRNSSGPPVPTQQYQPVPMQQYQPVPMQQYQPVPMQQFYLKQASPEDEKHYGAKLEVAGATLVGIGLGLGVVGAACLGVGFENLETGAVIGGIIITSLAGVLELIGIPLWIVGAIKKMASLEPSLKNYYADSDQLTVGAANMRFLPRLSLSSDSFSLAYSF